jgi:hypothetical protein
MLPVVKKETNPVVTLTMLMQQAPNANWIAQESGEPCTRPLTIPRQRTIDQNSHAAPNAWKNYWNKVTTFTTDAVGVGPSTLAALGGVVAA